MSISKARLIGIDGLGGSGKTTLARILEGQLENVVLFHIDDFIHPRKIRYDESFPEWEAYYHKQWRYDYLINTILQPLANGLSIDKSIEFYNKEEDLYIREQITIPVDTKVIIEGVFLQREELRKYLDFVIYIDVDKDTRLKRVLERDTYIGTEEEIIAKYEQRYFPAEEMYVKEYNPTRLADQVIVGGKKGKMDIQNVRLELGGF
ncbi:AAA family ATPase [Sporosarcina sp. UB5]|uniref:AAA family ATPase n=1 Tax=Sporosarcina sp. UB5 TaxID=3047463 RepID=UPI003D7B1994